MNFKKIDRFITSALAAIFLTVISTGCTLTVKNNGNSTTTTAAATATPTAAPSGLFSGGSGTIGDPYLIANATDLETLHTKLIGTDYNDYKSKYYKQTANINLGGAVKSYIPIGLSDTVPDFSDPFVAFATSPSSKPFLGTYDGDNKKIQNMKLESSSGMVYYYAFFLSLGSGAVVKNLIFENPTITIDAGIGAATVAGFSSGSIEHVTVTGLTANYGTLMMFSGGIVGNQQGGVGISDTTVAGNITGSTVNVWDPGSQDISAESENIGGIVGALMNLDTGITPALNNVSSAVNITGANGIAGVVAFIVGQVSVSHASNSGAIISHNAAAGFTSGVFPGSLAGVPGLADAALSFISNTGTITVTGAVGKYSMSAGLINQGKFTMSDSYNTGNVINNHSINGTSAGILNSPMISAALTRVYSTGDISYTGARVEPVGNTAYPYGQVAGLVGAVPGGNSLSLTNAFSTGQLTTEVGENTIGALIGSLWNIGTGDTVTVQNCYSANTYTGGNNGGTTGRSIANIYISNGALPTVNISNIYWGSDGYGANDGFSMSNVDQFVIAGGNDFRTAAVGLSEADMHLQASFAGFGFGTIWNAPNGSVYPLLR